MHHIEKFLVDDERVNVEQYQDGHIFEIDFNDEGYDHFKKEVERLGGESFCSQNYPGGDESIYAFIGKTADEVINKILIGDRHIYAQWEWIAHEENEDY